MFPDYHDVFKAREQSLRPDRRPTPRDAEIRLRVRRTIRVYL